MLADLRLLRAGMLVLEEEGFPDPRPLRLGVQGAFVCLAISSMVRPEATLVILVRMSSSSTGRAGRRQAS